MTVTFIIAIADTDNKNSREKTTVMTSMTTTIH